MDDAGHILAAGRAHAVHQPELRAVLRRPFRTLGPFDDVGHALFHRGGAVLGEEIRRQPDQVDMSVSGDHIVFHGQDPPTRIIAPKAAAANPSGAAQRYMRAQFCEGVAARTAMAASDRIRPCGRIAAAPSAWRKTRLEISSSTTRALPAAKIRLSGRARKPRSPAKSINAITPVNPAMTSPAASSHPVIEANSAASLRAKRLAWEKTRSQPQAARKYPMAKGRSSGWRARPAILAVMCGFAAVIDGATSQMRLKFQSGTEKI